MVYYRYSCIRHSDIFYKYDQCTRVKLKLFKNTKNIIEIKYNMFYNIICVPDFTLLLSKCNLDTVGTHLPYSNFILGLTRG